MKVNTGEQINARVSLLRAEYVRIKTPRRVSNQAEAVQLGRAEEPTENMTRLIPD